MEQDPASPLREFSEKMTKRQLRAAVKGGFRKEANEVKKIIASEVSKSGLGNARQVAKGLRVYVNSRGGGFMVNTVPRGKKGFHRNRFGKEKPVLMWAADGTKERWSKKSYNSRKYKAHQKRRMGRMTRYDYITKAERPATEHVEKHLLREVDEAVLKAAKKAGIG